MKKVLSFLLVMVMTATVMLLVVPPIEVSADSDIETAYFPMKYLNITQGINGSYSHQGTLALDLAGKDSGKDEIYAPFTGVIKRIYTHSGNFVWLESCTPVKFADGTVDYMTIMIGHDNDVSDLYVGKIIKQGEVFYREGNAGNATGNHIHLECAKGKYTSGGWYENSYGWWTIYNPVAPYDALVLKSDTIIKSSYGYNWRYEPDLNDYVHIKDDSYDTNFKAFPYAKITNDNLFDAGHNKMNANNWIAATDECTILEVYTDGCCKVTYPLDSGGTRTLYSKISLFNIVYDEWKANDLNIYTVNTGEIKRFSYTPSDSGVHFLDATSFNYKNFKVCLYDKEGNELKSNMADHIDAEYDLTAGEKYIFTLQFEDTSISGSIVCHFGRIYKLSYHANGGSGAPTTQQRKFNERETISDKKPTRDGYIFKGWSTNSSATTATYQPGDTFSTKADTTLYAVWAKGCENNAHNYDYDCDDTCNTCGHTRTITHSYSSSYAYNSNKHWQTCTICKSSTISQSHYYTNNCDTSCNACGYERTVTHIYTYDCDTDCNECGNIREAVEEHIYLNPTSLDDSTHKVTCRYCNKIDVRQHVYTNDCDTSCNHCKYERTITHSYDNDCDADCNVCGETRIVENKPNTKPNTNNIQTDDEDEEYNNSGMDTATIIIVVGTVGFLGLACVTAVWGKKNNNSKNN